MHEAPWSAYTVFALTAEAMLHLDGAGAVVAAPPGLPFKEWWAGLHGTQPSQADWRMHLTTLFPDVRPRGWIELRAIDTPGPEWWAVPPTLIAALLYDDRALTEVLDVLRPLADRIRDLNRSAARDGLRDPILGRVAEAVFDIGLTAARRFPAGYFDASGIAACERFRERYVSGHRMQADDHEPGIWVD